MKKFYDKKELLFAILLIVAYCVIISPLKANYGYASVEMLVGLTVFALGIYLFVSKYGLKEKYGLASWPKDCRRYLYFIPMWILCTGNIWGGFAFEHQGIKQLIAILSMILVGFVEEMLFRGFLFRALLSKNSTTSSIIITSLTFGIGHIINLFTGQASLETIVQIFFAIAWGFIFTMVCYKSGSIIPCIIAHSIIDVLAECAVYNPTADWIYVISTIIVSILYCTYLSKLKNSF